MKTKTTASAIIAMHLKNPKMKAGSIADAIGCKIQYVYDTLHRYKKKAAQQPAASAPVAVTPAPAPVEPSALDVQVDGDHYKKLKIQPVEYIHANNIPFIEGCIIKYATRWKAKGGVKDLEKIKHFADLLIEMESKAR